jgi:hypothetical protein
MGHAECPAQPLCTRSVVHASCDRRRENPIGFYIRVTDTRCSVMDSCNGGEAQTQDKKSVLNCILRRFVTEQQPNAIE